MAKIERKYLAHFLEVGQNYVRLGKDLEEYSPELSAQVEKTQNILGATAVNITGYEKTGTVEPYFAEVDDPLFQKLQQIIDGDLTLEDCKAAMVEVKLWEQEEDGYFTGHAPNLAKVYTKGQNLHNQVKDCRIIGLFREGILAEF